MAKQTTKSSSTNNATSLHIQQLELKVNLGFKKEERRRKRKVLVDIYIMFLKPPKACKTDRLEDTFCYDELIHHLHQGVASKQFCLIEYLCRDIYQLIKDHIATKSLAKQASVMVTLVKYPKLPGLKNGVRFSYCEA